MYVDTNCPGCQRKLRVPIEHAGQTARCPICNAIYTVPETTTSNEPADPQDRWRMKTPEGQEYGPVTRAALDGWVAEGRVSVDCQLLCEADGIWRGADHVYPVLRPSPIGVATPLWHNAPDSSADAIVPTPSQTGARGYVINADRGGIVLALGILSWAIMCPIFGVLAWVMGNNDLHEMRQGTMDARGQAMTEAGRVIGMLNTLLSVVVLVIVVFFLLFWGVFR